MISAAIGGMLIGLVAVWLMLSLGRIAGISGISDIVAPAVPKPRQSQWAIIFIAGLGLVDRLERISWTCTSLETLSRRRSDL